jgi:hypothetical protein
MDIAATTSIEDLLGIWTQPLGMPVLSYPKMMASAFLTICRACEIGTVVSR